ncbi:KAP family P-loop domain protein [anaerobic digester metagenome]
MDSQIGTAATGYVKLSDPVAEQTFDNLIGDRKVLVKRLTTLIQNTYNPYVIGLNSEWGSGKTFFLNAWRNYISAENPEAVCVYFNAWKNDCSGDPLANLMATVEEQITDPEEKANRAYAESARAVAAVASKLFKWGGKVLAATGNPVGGAAISFCGEAGEYLTNKIKEVNSAANDFCAKLEAFSKIVRDTTNFPLFIMVDELDRCRPDYAIELLERIKHLFDVQDVVFLLAIDGEQLLQQVEHTFGLKPSFYAADGQNSQPNKSPSLAAKLKTDTRLNYLGKFIDIFYQLPEPNRQEFVRMKLDKMPEMQNYCKKFSDAPYLKLGLVNVLTADANLFGNKSLRELIQNLELFSVFLRINESLSFEEIFTAFIIIIGNNNRMFISRNVSTFLRQNVYNYGMITNSFNSSGYHDESQHAYGNLEKKFNLSNPECVAHFWVCIEMLHTRESIYDNSQLRSLFDAAYTSTLKGIPYHISGQTLTPEISLTHMQEVEESLIKKLQLLDDFSQTVPSSTHNPEDDAMPLKMGKLHI